MDDDNMNNLNFDALPYGSPDGLHSRMDIMLLICYVVVYTKERLTDEVLIKTMTEGEFANYFEATSALQKIKDKELIKTDKQGFLKPANNCEYFVELVENELPYSMRTRAVEFAARLAVKALFRQENNVEIKKSGNDYIVTMHLTDSGKDFMVLTLTVPSAAQAEIIKEKFYANPANVYNNLIDSLFSNQE